MRILFLGDVVGISGCSKLTSNLLNEIDIEMAIDTILINDITYSLLCSDSNFGFKSRRFKA